MTDKSTSYQEAGFTLLELLVVIAVLGVLSSLMLTGFRGVNDGWRSLVRHDNNHRELQAAQELLRGLLSQAYPAASGPDASHRVVAFRGTGNEMDFLAPLSQRFSAADIVAYNLRVAEDGTLRLAWHLSRTSGEDFPRNHPTETAVIDQISSSQFVYFGSHDRKASPTWQTSWIGQDHLPDLIRIRLTRARRNDYSTRDLIIAPLLTGAICDTEVDGQCHD